jgi:hypothetical protein
MGPGISKISPPQAWTTPQPGPYNRLPIAYEFTNGPADHARTMPRKSRELLKPSEIPKGALPWERLPDESERAYLHFRRYLNLGFARSIHKVAIEIRQENAEENGGPPRGPSQSKERVTYGVGESLRLTATRFRWRERAAHYDHHAELAREKERLKIVAEDERRKHTAVRRRETQTLDIAANLKVKALKMLQWPLEEVTEESRTVEDDGRTVTVITRVSPAKWGMRDIAVFLKLAQELEDTVYFPRQSMQPQPSQDDASASAAVQEGGLQPLAPDGPEPSAEDVAAAKQTLSAWWARQNRRMLESPAPPHTPSTEPPETTSETPNGQEGTPRPSGSIGAAGRSIYAPTERGSLTGPPRRSVDGAQGITLGTAHKPASHGLVGPER